MKRAERIELAAELRKIVDDAREATAKEEAALRERWPNDPPDARPFHVGFLQGAILGLADRIGGGRT